MDIQISLFELRLSKMKHGDNIEFIKTVTAVIPSVLIGLYLI